MNPIEKLTLLVHTHESIGRIQPLIETTNWITNRIAIDMQSKDGTAETLAEAGFEVVAIEPQIFSDELRNSYLSLPKTPWTLVLDSDEYLADDASEQISHLIDSADADVVGFRIPRHNYIMGRKFTGSGWYPDHQLRLFKSNQVHYQPGHHLPPLTKNSNENVVVLEAPSCLHIHHNNYSTIAEMLSRQLHYTTTDIYDSTPDSFDFDDYMLSAIREFNKRNDFQDDGQLSYVAGMVMYWNEINRGLIHWEKTGYQGRLTTHLPNQVFLSNEFETLRREIDRLSNRDLVELEKVHNEYRKSSSWKLTAPFRRLSRMITSIRGNMN
jgi:hypothetical protein